LFAQRSVVLVRKKRKRARPPDPGKRSPGGVEAPAGTNRKLAWDHEKSSQRKNTKTKSKTQAIERHSFTVTSGRDAIGRIEQDGRDFTAYAFPADRGLGSFPTLKAASAAISAAHGGGR
jgi:hypothetical protein